MLNWQTRTKLRTGNITYINASAKFKDHNTIEYQKRNETKTVRGNKIVIAVGGRPRIPDIEGKELGITSDDIFRLETPPGKTLVIGGSYVALECAGFLSGLGYDTSVMIRSIPLRGFDRVMSEKVVDNMTKCNFIKGYVPVKLESNGEGKIDVVSVKEDEYITDTYDTVLFAIGRKINSESL